MTLLNYLGKALVEEGFAQHFLQDSFSSGHIGSAWGHCLPGTGLFCRPVRGVLQYTHDRLNERGLKVRQAKDPSPEEWTEWTAFGDDHLFAWEADEHRRKVVEAAAKSIEVVLQTAVQPEQDDVEILFPVPVNCKQLGCRDRVDMRLEEDIPPCEESAAPPSKDLARWSGGRSRDYRVGDQPLEGWKVLASVGAARGNFDKLNADGSIATRRRTRSFSSYELGYVQSTEWYFPNYLGAGVELIHGQRTSIFPFSFGCWRTPRSRFYFGGVRMNLGVRLDERLVHDNPRDRIRSSFVANWPLEIGFTIYAPLAVYVRTELATVTLAGVTENGPAHFETETIFKGQAPFSIGIRWDLSGVL